MSYYHEHGFCLPHEEICGFQLSVNLDLTKLARLLIMKTPNETSNRKPFNSSEV